MSSLFLIFLLTILPQSSFDSEEDYIFYLEKLIKQKDIEETTQIHARWLLEGMLKNRPGAKAINFSFLTRNGDSINLYETIDDFPNKSDILLIFYDPDCNHCKDIMDTLINSEYIRGSITQGKLNVIAVYSGDEKEIWQQTASNLPKEWIVGYEDATIQDEEDYIIPSLPYIFMLSFDKTILRKNLLPKELGI